MMPEYAPTSVLHGHLVVRYVMSFKLRYEHDLLLKYSFHTFKIRSCEQNRNRLVHTQSHSLYQGGLRFLPDVSLWLNKALNSGRILDMSR